jgi:hypothetical protein
MRAADLTGEHIGQTVTVEVDHGPSGRISATGELVEASHGYSLEMIDGTFERIPTTAIRLMFTDTLSALIAVRSDNEVQPN